MGRRLARQLNVAFRDSDDEVARAAGRPIPEIFATMGEAAFREGERKVIARLLEEGPMVLATGGGAFMDLETRTLIKQAAISVWLKAQLDVLVERTARRGGRPLLANGDPRRILARLMTERHPIYAEADLTVRSAASTHTTTVNAILDALRRRQKELERRARRGPTS